MNTLLGEGCNSSYGSRSLLGGEGEGKEETVSQNIWYIYCFSFRKRSYLTNFSLSEVLTNCSCVAALRDGYCISQPPLQLGEAT